MAIDKELTSRKYGDFSNRQRGISQKICILNKDYVYVIESVFQDWKVFRAHDFGLIDVRLRGC